jgi:GT2 family glycosyltransferase
MTLHRSWAPLLANEAFIPFPLDERGLPLNPAPAARAKHGKDPWLVAAPAKARLSPDFIEVLRRHAESRRDVGVFYADEVEMPGVTGNRLLLKPSTNLTLLLADDYIGYPVMVRASALERLGGFRYQAQTAVVYDLTLRAIRAGIGIERIPKVMLAHDGPRPRALIEHRRAVLQTWIGAHSHLFEVSSGLTETSLQLVRRFTEHPKVTLVIPTNQSRQLQVADDSFGKPHIVNLLQSLARTDWPMERIEVLIGDDVPDAGIYPDALRKYPFHVRHIVTERAPGTPFNYAAKMNSLWRQTETEHMVLMNDDVVVREPGWLRALMTFAMDEEVGGAGARLLYGDGRLQHAGIPGGLFGACAHAWMGQAPRDPTYNDWALVHREWSMVTGAVFATRRAVLERLNGFDERFTLEFNDIDLCLRMGLIGYKIVYTPFAELLHYEKSSRGEAMPRGDQVALFLKRWTELLDDDPAFHPGFDRWNLHIIPLPTPGAWYA